LGSWQLLLGTATAIAARTAFVARAPVRLIRESLHGCRAEFAVAFDLGGRAVVKPLENPFAILRGDLVQQLLSAKSPRLDLNRLLS
jgi:hypothetical protein